MANETEANRHGLEAAASDAENNEERQTAGQASAELENAESDVTVHQSIDEYNHI